MFTKTTKISTNASTSCVMKRASPFEFEGKSRELTQHDQNFPKEGKSPQNNTRLRRKKEMQKNRILKITGICVGKLTIFLGLFEIEEW